jgi:diguanylate cyclase (GGDEF)-like protein/PAS domain S-box-containing protein
MDLAEARIFLDRLLQRRGVLCGVGLLLAVLLAWQQKWIWMAALAGFAAGTLLVTSLLRKRMVSLDVPAAPASRESRRSPASVQLPAQLQAHFDELPAGLVTLDLQGRILRANASAAHLMGVTQKVLLTQRWDDYFFAIEWDVFMATLDNHGTRVDVEVGFQVKYGDHVENKRASVSAKKNGDRIEALILDITEKAKIRDYMEFLARHDPLTKTLNRLGIEKHLKKRIDQMSKGGLLCVAYLDLDGFKMVNDVHGHQAGDELLIGVCRRIGELLPRRTRLGRVGGDEFLMVFGGVDLEAATQVCNFLIQSITAAPFQAHSMQVSVSGSIGLIEVKPGSALKDAITQADNACRQAKSEGKSRVVVHSKNDQSRLQYEGDMKLADNLVSGEVLEHLGFQLQPILSTQRPDARLDFEVLLQLADDQGDSMPTARFFAVAKKTGQMPKVDTWMLSTMLNWVRNNQPRLVHTDNIFINLSGASLNDGLFVEGVLGVMDRFRDVAPMICLEVTEDVALKNLYQARQFFLKLKDMGVRIALDDFGAGYTSFAYLRHLPSDFLKIDGSLIANINDDPANAAIVRGILNMARSLQMKTIAEWAEDADCVRTLLEIGVDYIQGYAIARPMAAEAVLLLDATTDAIQDEKLRTMLAGASTGL